MKNIILLLISIISTSILAQGEAPEGWDKIYLENEIAYMNSATGEISTTLPRGYARAKKKVNTNNNFKATNVEANGIHTVVNGDTLSKIARKYNMSLSDLYSLNNVDNFDKLEIGQQINVNERNAGIGNKYHTVKTGETLYRISQKYSITVAELKSLNSLNSNAIAIGQKLIIN